MRVFYWVSCVNSETHCVTPYCLIELVSIGSGNGLLPDGTKPLPAQMLTYNQWCSVAFTWDWFHSECSSYNSVHRIWKLYFQVLAISPRGQRVKEENLNWLTKQSLQWVTFNANYYNSVTMTIKMILLLCNTSSLFSNNITSSGYIKQWIIVIWTK